MSWEGRLVVVGFVSGEIPQVYKCYDFPPQYVIEVELKYKENVR